MRLCILVGVAISFTPVAAQETTVKEEMKKLEGKWARVSVEGDGKNLTGKENKPKVVVTITGEKWIETATGGTGKDDGSTFKIDPAKKPKEIDITSDLGRGKTTFSGIYTLDGDTLKTAVPFPFGGDFTGIGKRPSEFRTKQGDGFLVIIYKRMNE